MVVEPESGVTAILSDLLRTKLPLSFRKAVAVVGLNISSDRASDINRLVRNGRVLSQHDLEEVLHDAAVVDGWFFVGVPGQVGDAVDPPNVPELLSRSAFVVDILEGRFLFVRTINPAIAQAARDVVIGAQEIEQCELQDVRLSL
jgi:hypothetical protein